MEDCGFTESSPLLPRKLTYLLAALFGATVLFMAAMVVSGIGDMPAWMLWTSAVVFVAVTLFALFARLDVSVSDEGVDVMFIVKRSSYPRDDILDKRHGDLGDIKSYSNWSLKGVKHTTYSRVGDECGVALKLKGKRVVVISSARAEEMFRCVPTEIIEEDRDA